MFITAQEMRTEVAPAGAFDDQLAARLLHQRIVVLGQEVDDPIANRICAQLLLLSAEDQRRDISLYINSPGGSVSAGLAIYDTMRLIPNDVSTLAMGIAASMGQFLLSAGTRGKRYALPHARILMHQGSAGIRGTAVDVADPGREPRVHQGFDDPVDRRAHRAGARDDRQGRRPRSLVHRRAGAGLRLRRPGSAVRRRRPAGRRPAADRAGLTMGHYTVPTVVEKTPSGERVVDVFSRLLSDRIIYLGTEIDDDVANVIVAQLLYLESDNPDREISAVHQLSRRIDVGDDGHLRHHAIRPGTGGHHLRRAGRLGRRGDPGRRRAGAAIAAAAHQGAAAPAVSGRAGHHLGSDPAGQGTAAGARADGGGAQPAHRAGHGDAARGHRPGQDLHRRAGGRATGWPTTSSPPGARAGAPGLTAGGGAGGGVGARCGLRGPPDVRRMRGVGGVPARSTCVTPGSERSQEYCAPAALTRGTSVGGSVDAGAAGERESGGEQHAARSAGGRRGRSRRAQRRANSARPSPSAPQAAASISDDASLRPRSSSDRYCTDMPGTPGDLGERALLPAAFVAQHAAGHLAPQRLGMRVRAEPGAAGRGRDGAGGDR